MPDICTNMLYLSTEDRELRDVLVETISQKFDCNEINPAGNNGCGINFNSRWTFPHREMEEMTKGLPEENDLYIRVHSYEFGCEYVGFNIYTNGEWCNKFAD
ncbi:hypothetical protein FACS189435_4830 [Bacteroidia bacterium]|nr:hypothetical protein FACS189435_4830 [Bacteroidia bacterium]